MNSQINENNEKEKAISEKLRSILEQVKSEINFAEAKNGLGLTVISAVFYKLLELYSKSNIIMYKLIYLPSAFILLIPMWKCFSSFKPNTDKFIDEGNESLDREERLKKRNLMFYGNISQYNSSKIYLEDLCSSYSNIDIENVSKEYLDYSEQILINARIASNKYNSFKSAIKWIEKIATVFFISMLVAAISQKIHDSNIKYNNYNSSTISIEINSDKANN